MSSSIEEDVRVGELKEWLLSDVGDSEMAFDILKILNDGEYSQEDFEGYYSKEISEEADYNNQAVSKMLSKMAKHSLVYRSKRTKAQFYRIDKEGIIRICKIKWEISGIVANHIEEHIEKDFEHDEPKKWAEALKKLSDGFEQPEFDDEVVEYTREYVDSYLGFLENKTINQMFGKDFQYFMSNISYFKRFDAGEDIPNVERFFLARALSNKLAILSLRIYSNVEQDLDLRSLIQIWDTNTHRILETLDD